MTDAIRGEVDDVDSAIDTSSAAVMVELDGAIVVARIDANTSKRAIQEALLEINDQLDRAIQYRSGELDAETEQALATDGGWRAGR